MFCTDITVLINFFTWKVSLKITIFLVASETAETGEEKRQRREWNDFEKSENKLSQQKSIFTKLSEESYFPKQNLKPHKSLPKGTAII